MSETGYNWMTNNELLNIVDSLPETQNPLIRELIKRLSYAEDRSVSLNDMIFKSKGTVSCPICAGSLQHSICNLKNKLGLKLEVLEDEPIGNVYLT